MAHKNVILLDSNAYLRIADSVHPLLGERFGEQGHVLYLIPEFQKEFNKSQRLKNKFGWVNQPEYIENRKHLLKRTREQAKQIELTYSYLWEYTWAKVSVHPGWMSGRWRTAWCLACRW